MSDCLEWPVYGLSRADKRERLEGALSRLTRHHAANCLAYRQILAARGIDPETRFALEDLPFLPVRLFKEEDLRSVEQDKVIKVLTSSGTTSQHVSRIFLDSETSLAQTRALVRILQSFIGKARLPMLIIDHPGVVKDRRSFSARGAGILGLSNFGRDHRYALNDEDMSINRDAVLDFTSRHAGERVLLFGFTFMVWKYFIQALAQRGERLGLHNSILVHSGGWKKLQEEAVDNPTFKRIAEKTVGARAVHNFYGMVEQVGSIFVECEHGRLHAPAFADVLVRNPLDWSICAEGETGVLQVLSVLPVSYPGHSLLTEDMGAVLGEDDCPCGRRGKYFRVDGRIARAEMRGCSDTHTPADQVNQ
jgi:phenylacetate-coenzyme A ligase PaaK-like adenylate-forming protein